MTGQHNLSCKLAFEVPFKNLDYASMFGDYIFALAHLVESNSDYMNWVTNRAEDMDLYLDNGAYELGESMDIRGYIHIVEALMPTVVVVPDALGDHKKTVQMAQSFFNSKPPRGPKYMVVPQGKNTDEWILCLHKMVRMFRHEFHIIGVPRIMYPSRLQLSRHAQTFTKKPIHLLGCVDPSEIAGILKSFVLVQSIDTSWPARHALKKLKEKIDFENDDLDFDTFQASVEHFMNMISPRVPEPIAAAIEEVATSTTLLVSDLEKEEDRELASQFAPPKGKKRIPMPKIDEEDGDDD